MYNKIFTKILDSSIWLEPNGTRLVWLTLIAAMDEDGMVQFASVANLAHRARVTVEEARSAVECLESPDQDSSDPDNEGRRIERVPGGWIILNAKKYQELVTRAVTKEQTRIRVANHRERKRLSSNAGVTECNGAVSVSGGAETQDNEKVTPSDTATHTSSATTIPPKAPAESKASPSPVLESKTPTSPLAIRFAELYRRRLTTEWSDKEIRVFKTIGKLGLSDADIDLISDYTKAQMDLESNGKKGFHRRDLLTFLNNLSGELDRARGWKDSKKPNGQNGIREGIRPVVIYDEEDQP